jgi:hypothetical protein
MNIMKPMICIMMPLAFCSTCRQGNHRAHRQGCAEQASSKV